MSYATYSDFSARYATRLSAEEVSSHCLPYAAARLEGVLGAHFPVPFSANNVTARDLTIDLAYLLVLQRSREPGDTRPLAESVRTRIAALAAGREAMMTTSGQALFAAGTAGGVWGSTVADSPYFAVPVTAAGNGEGAP